MFTTIQVKKETLERLKDFKQHPRQSYDETINELMNANEVEVLTMEDIEEIKEGLDDIKHGRVITLEDYKKKHGLSRRTLKKSRKVSRQKHRARTHTR